MMEGLVVKTPIGPEFFEIAACLKKCYEVTTYPYKCLKSALMYFDFNLCIFIRSSFMHSKFCAGHTKIRTYCTKMRLQCS